MASYGAASRLRADGDQPLAAPLKVERTSYLSWNLHCALKSINGAVTKVERTFYLRRRRWHLHTGINHDNGLFYLAKYPIFPMR